jgi:type I restriction enzyme S subunit
LNREVIDLVNSSTYGAKMPRASWSFLGSVEMPIPPLREQPLIATFLDRETAKIDALIAEQQRLIELLQEKRQAVISHAVTKGLNPDAPMKDSGVEWLGEVPEHWEALPMKRLLLKIEQGWSPECLAKPADDDEWGVVKAGCVNRGIFNPNENKTLPLCLNAPAEYEIQAGDLLMSRASGSPELIGSAAVISQVRPKLLLSDKIFRLRTNEKVGGRYLAAVLASTPLRQQIRQAISGAVGLANNLPQAEIKNFVLALPPRDEQSCIEAFIARESERLDDLLENIEKTIELLRERRSALISAAVTGQIDVRGLVPAASAE